MDKFSRVWSSKGLVTTLVLGFLSGVPLALSGATLQAWMMDAQVDLKTIGIFSLVGLPYNFKFIWAPLLDRFQPLILDRRRGWALTFQILLAMALVGMSFYDPSTNLKMIAVFAVLIAFLSASQDIVIDAYRVEMLSEAELGLGSSLAITGYRVGMLFSGGFALSLAGFLPWAMVMKIMAAVYIPGALYTYFVAPEIQRVRPPRSFMDTFVVPLKEFLVRKGAFEILGFICLYKLGDVLSVALMTPFMMTLGYTKPEIGVIAKTFGLGAVIAGGIIGGLMLLRMRLGRALLIFGVIQALPALGFILLQQYPPHQGLLAFVIGMENFTSGLGNAAFAAFMGRLCNKRFTAFQYALLTSLMAIPRSTIASRAGVWAQELGWTNFYILCVIVAIPGILMVVTRYRHWETHAFPKPDAST